MPAVDENQLAAEILAAEIEDCLAVDVIREEMLEGFKEILQNFSSPTVLNTCEEILTMSLNKKKTNSQYLEACKQLFEQYLTQQELQELHNKISSRHFGLYC